MRNNFALFAGGILITASMMLSLVTSVEAQTLERASVISAVAPVFPLPDKGPWVMGSVVVEALINSNGNVVVAHAITGHPFLYRASEEAARRWLFAPSADKSKERMTRLTFIFKMMEDDTADQDLSPIFMPPYKIEVRRIVPVMIQRNTRSK